MTHRNTDRQARKLGAPWVLKTGIVLYQ